MPTFGAASTRTRPGKRCAYSARIAGVSSFDPSSRTQSSSGSYDWASTLSSIGRLQLTRGAGEVVAAELEGRHAVADGDEEIEHAGEIRGGATQDAVGEEV